MFTRDTSDCGIDSIYCAEVEIKRPEPGKRLRVEALMVYANRERGETYGTCPLVYDSAVHGVEGYDDDDKQKPESPRTLSTETLKALEKFLELVEKDLGRLVFTSGQTAQVSDQNKAESDEGLRVGLGGQT